MILSVQPLGIQEGTDAQITASYRVVTDGNSEPTDILGHASIPQTGARYSVGSVLTCLSRSASTNGDSDRDIWTVQATFGPRESTATGGSTTPSGASERIQSLGFTSRLYDVVAEEGYLGAATTKTPVENSAGDPFDPPLMIQLANIVINLTQRERPQFDPVRALTYLNTLNEEAITVVGLPIGAQRAQLLKVDPQRQADGGYVTAYEIEVSSSVPFARRVLDQGFRALQDPGGGFFELRGIRLSDINTNYASGGPDEENDAFVSDPVKLDGSGQILTTGAEPVYRTYRLLPAKNWNTGLDLVKRVK